MAASHKPASHSAVRSEGSGTIKDGNASRPTALNVTDALKALHKFVRSIPLNVLPDAMQDECWRMDEIARAALASAARAVAKSPAAAPVAHGTETCGVEASQPQSSPSQDS